MNKKPEALRLADLIDTDLKNSAHHDEAAAELRRLHEINQELMRALEQIEVATACAFSRNIARAAIAKAEGEQK